MITPSNSAQICDIFFKINSYFMKENTYPFFYLAHFMVFFLKSFVYINPNTILKRFKFDRVAGYISSQKYLYHRFINIFFGISLKTKRDEIVVALFMLIMWYVSVSMIFFFFFPAYTLVNYNLLQMLRAIIKCSDNPTHPSFVVQTNYKNIDICF